MKSKRGKKVPLNLNIDAEVKRLMKIQCATDSTTVSAVTEDLYVEHLDEQKGKRKPLQNNRNRNTVARF